MTVRQPDHSDRYLSSCKKSNFRRNKNCVTHRTGCLGRTVVFKFFVYGCPSSLHICGTTVLGDRQIGHFGALETKAALEQQQKLLSLAEPGAQWVRTANHFIPRGYTSHR